MTDEVKRLTAEEEPSHDEPCRHPARARHGIHETYVDVSTGEAQCRACGARTVIPVGPPRLDAAREETIRAKASTRAQYVRRSYLRDVLSELDATRSTLAASREREGRLVEERDLLRRETSRQRVDYEMGVTERAKLRGENEWLRSVLDVARIDAALNPEGDPK